MGYIGGGLPGRIDDDELLRRLWSRGLSTKAIAETFGVKPPAVSRRVRILDLPRRTTPTSALADRAKAARNGLKVEPAARITAPPMPPHPFWTAERDIAVMSTAGSGEAISQLAVALGRSIADVTLRWHRLRAA